MRFQIISNSILTKATLQFCNVSKGTYLVWLCYEIKDNSWFFIMLVRLNNWSRETLLHEWLDGGSIIIITSRDEHILRTHGINNVYRV